MKNQGDGRMGFRDLHSYNKALLVKQAWRIVKNLNASWVKFLKSIYFPKCEFLESKCKKGNSWLWKSLSRGKELLKKGLRWEVGNGEKIKFWDDPWIPTLEIFKIRTNRLENNNIVKVKEVIK